jgi:DNA-binding MarR family transcriptional regulator
VADSSAAGSAAASPVTAMAGSATGTVDAAIRAAGVMGPAAAIGAADCPASGLLATAAAESDKLDHDILDAMIALFRQILVQSERLAGRHGVPLFCVKALHILDTSMAMKELGLRMGCDPSFVTAIADTLEKRGLARREASPADRRVKNLVLSSEGVELKEQIEAEMLADMPWVRALDRSERTTFLALIRKLTDTATGTAAAGTADATASSPATPSGGGRAGEVSDALDNASAG